MLVSLLLAENITDPPVVFAFILATFPFESKIKRKGIQSKGIQPTNTELVLPHIRQSYTATS